VPSILLAGCQLGAQAFWPSFFALLTSDRLPG
jgi:hypothetical protein